jgi:large subunit ribosomal protein L23
VIEEKLLTVLQAPHVSEKSARAGSSNYQQYVFRVAPTATKPLIRQAVEKLLKTKVRSVRVCNVKSKPARFGRIAGRHKGWKKAYVLLEAQQEINLMGE